MGGCWEHKGEENLKKLNALSIGGFDTGAGAGVESDIKAFESVGVHGLGVVTAITAQNTLGIKGTLLIEPDFLKKQIETIFTDFEVSAVKTGMIVSSGQMKVISELIDRLTVVDPVIVAKDGTRLIEDLDSFKKMILPKAYVLTPNAVEAEALAGFKVVSIEDQIRAAKSIHDLFSIPYVIVKGGHIQSDEVVDVLYNGKETMLVRSHRLENRNTHGTGSVFASMLAGMLAKGIKVEEALPAVKSRMEESIKFGLEIGKGIGPVEPLVSLERDSMRFKVLRDMEMFADFVESQDHFHVLIPEVQSNLAHSISPEYVEGLEDIATFKGRIIREWGGRVRVGMPPSFGYPTHTARLLLSIVLKERKGDTLINIRYDQKLVRAFKNIGYEVLEVDREKEPKGEEGRTMSWIVEYVSQNHGKLPNVIFDTGIKGKEAMIRFWTESIDEMMHSISLVLKEVRT